MEHLLAKEGVAGSIPVSRSRENKKWTSIRMSIFCFSRHIRASKVRLSPLRSGPRKAEVHLLRHLIADYYSLFRIRSQNNRNPFLPVCAFSLSLQFFEHLIKFSGTPNFERTVYFKFPTKITVKKFFRFAWSPFPYSVLDFFSKITVSEFLLLQLFLHSCQIKLYDCFAGGF